MEVTEGTEEAFVREWTPCTHILNLIPPKTQTGLFSSELCLTCVDAVSEFIALGTNVGLVYWYDRRKGTLQRLRCEAATSSITYVKIANTVDFMVAAGNEAGQVTVFQIPKEHPENIPDTFKPKVEPKVERYTIGDLHKSKITAIEWSKNGMRLFSGDMDGVIIMTELDFYMHLCKSMEIVNEEYEIVQMSYYQNSLLVSSVYRTIVCERSEGKWHVNQIGKKERKSLCRLGAVFQYSYAPGATSNSACAYCARPGLRLWRADLPHSCHVLQTLLFKEAISNPLTVAELLNPSQKKHSHAAQEYNFGPLYVFREHFLISHNEHILYVLDPRSLTAVAVVDDLRRILSVSVTKDEIFILEGPRSLIRLGNTPEPASLAPEDPINLMTKSLTSSLQQAVNTVRDLTHMDQTVPFIASVLEQPIAIFTKSDNLETGTVASAEECLELPPIKQLPDDVPNDVLVSIINEFKDVSSEVDEIRRIKSEELEKKLKLYNSIMEKKNDEELIHSSRRSRRKDNGSGDSTPRMATPVRKRQEHVNYTTPCVMDVSVYNETQKDTNDELLEKQIEEKEKILAKMLNLESLSIKSAVTEEVKEEENPQHENYMKFIHFGDINKPEDEPKEEKPSAVSRRLSPVKKEIKDFNSIDLIPKVVSFPDAWNLDNIEVRIEANNGFEKNTECATPDVEWEVNSEWEII